MIEHWEDLLPQEYSRQVIRPMVFEQYTEPSVKADKIIGFDSLGNKCFYYHSFIMSDEGFDVDEFPILIDVYYERVVAWRISEGRWVQVKSYTDRLDSCNRHLTTLPAELTDSMPK